jgi:uncharacterized protein YjbI with pentapeptide repeats
MKIIKPRQLSLLTRPFEFKREFWLGVAVIAYLPVGDTPTLLRESALWPFLAEELPPDQPLDAALPKTRPEYLAVAHAFAPNGIAAPQVRTGIQLGPLIKMLDVFGDRFIDEARASEPVPFTTMKIDWNLTYGGANFADNPLGKGVDRIDRPDGSVLPVPNVVNPKLGREGIRIPSNYGPVVQMWPARAKLIGTYDDAWLKQDFPGFARDIDWSFFNVAPPDQWLPDYLKGDESYAFKHLHPEQSLLKGRLPGMVPRLFLVRKGQADSFEEVPLSLTTVWFFPHRERLVLVHHGQTRLAEEDASDIARVVVGADRLGAHRPAEDFRAVMVKRTGKDGSLHVLRDADLVPAEWLAPDPDPPAEPSDRAKIRGRRQQRMERDTAAAREKVRAKGLDPDKFGPPSPPPVPPIPKLEELPDFLAKVKAEAAAQKDQAAAKLAAKKADIAKRLAAIGMSPQEIQQKLEATPKGPPAFSASRILGKLQAQITAMRMLGQLTMGLEAQLAAPEIAEQLHNGEAAARNGYRLSAQHQDPADTMPAAQSAEIRRLVSGDAAAARALYDLHGADLSGLDLSGIDLSGVCLDAANLTGTSFAGAKLANAVLAHAHMEGCNLDDANLAGANLGKAHLTGATLRRSVLAKAVLAGTDLTNASLVGADLAGADLNGTIVAGADFSELRAHGIVALKLLLRDLHAPRVVLSKAKFIDCDLEGADLTGAVLEGAVFINTNLTAALLAGARMRKAVFVKKCLLVRADLSGADLTEANLRETIVRGANLDNAIIERADLSGADLTGALLRFARATGSSLIAADLRRADLRLANFSNADLSRADLRGANLTGISAYAANMPRVKLDIDTRRGGMFRTKLRYLPVYQPPEASAT